MGRAFGAGFAPGSNLPKMVHHLKWFSRRSRISPKSELLSPVSSNKNPVWEQALKSCADPARATHFLELLSATSAGTKLPKYSAEQARILAALFSGSLFLGNLLVGHPDWLDLF